MSIDDTIGLWNNRQLLTIWFTMFLTVHICVWPIQTHVLDNEKILCNTTKNCKLFRLISSFYSLLTSNRSCFIVLTSFASNNLLYSIIVCHSVKYLWHFHSKLVVSVWIGLKRKSSIITPTVIGSPFTFEPSCIII